MEKILSSLLLMALFCAGTAKSASASWPVMRNWNEDQKSVWRSIEDHWMYLTSGDTEKFLSYLHPNFTGYGHESPLLINKDSIAKWVVFWIKNTQIPVHELQPMAVSVYDNFAVVHYYISTLEIGKEKTERVIRRYTSTCVKDKGKWLIIGNHNERIQGW